MKKNSFLINQNQGRKSKSSTPVLDNFGRDLTKMASDDKLIL